MALTGVPKDVISVVAGPGGPQGGSLGATAMWPDLRVLLTAYSAVGRVSLWALVSLSLTGEKSYFCSVPGVKHSPRCL